MGTIRQQATIASARYEMSACEMDILFYLLLLLKKGQMMYDISIPEIEAATGRQWQYNQCKKTIKNLGNRAYEVDIEGRYHRIWFLLSTKYINGTGCIEIEIHEQSVPYLFGIKKDFTESNIKAVFALKSKYAKRIYQLANQWKRKGQKEYTIHELKVMLMLKDPKGKLPEKMKQFGEFKKNVLEIAKRQINENTDMEIDYTLKKKGRSFHSTTFHFKTKKRTTQPR